MTATDKLTTAAIVLFLALVFSANNLAPLIVGFLQAGERAVHVAVLR